MIALPALAELAARRAPRAEETCDLCGADLAAAHRHVLELATRSVQCACHACAILFARREAGAQFRTIPDRVRRDLAFGISATRWTELGIPVALAFCVRDSRRGGVVCYPGPAGIVEGELEDVVWSAVCAATPLGGELEDDVEALLIRGARGVAGLACYLVPISTAFELVGRLRTSWQGFGGGASADQALEAFFTELDHRGGRP